MLLSFHSHSAPPPKLKHSSPNNSQKLHLSAICQDSLLFSPLKQSNHRSLVKKTFSEKKKILASLSNNGSPATSFDYDLVIIGAGVGGHGAALHAVEKVYILVC